MTDKNLQLESGNYIRVVNKVIDELVKTPLLGAELSICLFIIRKTWGYNKKTDQISLTQFEHGIGRSRPTIIKALKSLQLVNIIQLVKTGTSKSESSEWKFNKYYNSWKLVGVSLPVEKGGIAKVFNGLVNPYLPVQLVNDEPPTGKRRRHQLVKTGLHTKDNTKYNIQKTGEVNSPPTPKENAKYFFKGVIDLRDKVDSQEATSTRTFLQELEKKYPDAPKNLIWAEIQKFERYWTEKNSTGNKELWQMQKAFEVDRRLVTWFGKINQFKKVNNNQKTHKEILL